MTADHVIAPPLTKLIVIGASAGGLAPLTTILGDLPADLPAAVVVVVHIGIGPSLLPTVLSRATRLVVAAASPDTAVVAGRVVVAPPDRHVLVEAGALRLDGGPREHGHRPAIDPLFRSAAQAYGRACCGVILSGARDDGALGLATIRRHGGVTVIQDPKEATYPSMPSTALAASEVDRVLPAAEIAAYLVTLATRPDRRPAVPAGRHEVSP